MSEYTSTREGFQRAMKWTLTGPPEEVKLFTEATLTPTFYQIRNGQRIEGDAYVKGIEQYRGIIKDYDPIVQEFLRDGDQLAARMTGAIKLDGNEIQFECFMFGKIDKESGKIESLVERIVQWPVGEAPGNGTN